MSAPFKRLTSSAVRVGMAAQNALEVARFGGLDTGEESSPFNVVGRTPTYRLRHYFPDDNASGPPLILVPPLMLSAEVYDVSPAVSGVGALREMGVDPWVVDFGAPEKEEGGLRRTLADHVLAVSDAVDRVREATGRDKVHLGGYSQGGMFGYQTTAYRRGDGIGSLITFGSPVDVHLLSPVGIPVAQLADIVGVVADNVLAKAYIPAGLSRRAFQMVDPLKTARNRLNFLMQLHNRDALIAREGSRKFLEVNGWVAWPGPALAEFATQFVAHNRMLSGGFEINGQMVSLADISVPTLAVVGTGDEIASPPAVRAIRRAAPHADIYELTLPAGHMGLVVGSGARERSWPVASAWIHWQEGEGPLPEGIAPLTEDHPESEGDPPALEVATEIVIGAAQVVTDTARSATRAVRGVFSEAVDQLPRLARLERVDADTRMSLALLLDERARRQPDQTFFLFQGRGYSYAEAMKRVDAITMGLISLGVRQGDHIGVLMRTRPTGVALTTALSRLGAVAVMLRPDGDLPREIRLGQVSRLVSDPDHLSLAKSVWPGQVLLLGAAHEAREPGEDVLDMERLDVDSVAPPRWYEPNPGRARDLSMILFTGGGVRTRANRITNRRWALSAFGTASAASLSDDDTVYAVSPLHHPATLLTAIGGAVTSGARLAMAESFDAETFWTEVRRYGVSVVSYTWAMVHSLLAADAAPGERHHPVRLFMGSGMPRGLWERVVDRFRPARVLEFYAHSEGEVVLANLSRGKVGAMGRPLPGTAEVAVAAYDLDTGTLESGADGFVRRAEADEPGMLLTRVGSGRADVRGRLLRGVFRKGDAWMSTGDLFQADDDGDLWLLGPARSAIRTVAGPVYPNMVSAALEGDDAVDLSGVYGHRPDQGGPLIAVAAVTVRPGRALTDAGLRSALAGLDRHAWPQVVRIVDTMPLTAHHRVQTEILAAESIEPGSPGLCWDHDTQGYVPL